MTKSALELADTFVTDILGTKTLDSVSTKQKCFATSYPLSLHLENNGFKNSMVFGEHKDGTKHVWLVLDQNKDKIVDSTYSQFYFDKPGIYFDVKPKDFTAFYEERFTGAYDDWLAPFLNPTAYKGAENYKSTGVDPATSLRIAVKSAIILNNEIENLTQDIYKFTIKRQLFFCAIFQILNSYPDDLAEFSNTKDFDSLLCRAKNNK